MNDYLVVQNGATEFLVVKRVDDDIYHVIAQCGNRDNAAQIVEAMRPVPELRTSWSELERIAAERGLR